MGDKHLPQEGLSGSVPSSRGHAYTLYASERSLRLAVEAADIFWWELDLIDDSITCSDNATQLIGSAPGNTWTACAALMHPLDRARCVRLFEQAAENGMDYFSCEVRSLAGGKARWFLLGGKIVKNAQGQPLQAIGTAQHITQRKQAEMALRLNEERMRSLKEAYQCIVDGAPLCTSLNILAQLVQQETGGEGRVAFYMADPELKSLHPILGAGTMPETYLEAVDGFAIGTHSIACGLAIPTGRPVITADVLLEPDWRPWLHLATRFQIRACWSFPVKTRDNKAVGTFGVYFSEPRQMDAHDRELADLLAQAIAVIIASHVENQERIKAETALRNSEEALRKLLQQKDEFIGIASHELKTPVTSIKAYGELLLDQFEKNEDVTATILMEKMNRQVDRLTRLIKDLLDATRITEGTLQLSLGKLDLHALIGERLEELRHTSAQHRIALDLQPASAVMADKERIGQVITNLVGNAIKYSPAGGTITVTVTNVPEGVEVSVRDEGIGIAVGAQQRLFERFYRVNDSRTEHVSGMGLGLYISAQIIEHHGGRMKVLSEEGQGAVFSFLLPYNCAL